MSNKTHSFLIRDYIKELIEKDKIILNVYRTKDIIKANSLNYNQFLEVVKIPTNNRSLLLVLEVYIEKNSYHNTVFKFPICLIINAAELTFKFQRKYISSTCKNSLVFVNRETKNYYIDNISKGNEIFNYILRITNFSAVKRVDADLNSLNLLNKNCYLYNSTHRGFYDLLLKTTPYKIYRDYFTINLDTVKIPKL